MFRTRTLDCGVEAKYCIARQGKIVIDHLG